jgi:hypothetical protein
MSSFDARSKGQPWPLLSIEASRVGKPVPLVAHISRRGSWTRAVKDQSAPIPRARCRESEDPSPYGPSRHSRSSRPSRRCYRLDRPSPVARLPLSRSSRSLSHSPAEPSPIPKRERASLEGANGSSGFAGWKPSGIPAARIERPCALVSSSFPSRLNPSDFSFLRPCTRSQKASPAERRDFLLGKGYSAGGD